MLASTTRGSGPSIVLLHGFTQTSQSWARVVERLVARGYRVVCVDAPGHGGSGDIPAGLWETADLLAEVVAYRCGTGDECAPTVVGYSMGGRMALHLALAHPRSAARLVLLGATAGIVDPTERAERRRADDALAASIESEGVAAFLPRWLSSPLFATLAPEQADLNDRRRNSAPGLASSLRLSGTGVQADLWPRLGELRMPVLLAAGELDVKFRDIGAAMAARIADARQAILAGAGHAAHLERPDEFAQLVLSFITGIPEAL